MHLKSFDVHEQFSLIFAVITSLASLLTLLTLFASIYYDPVFFFACRMTYCAWVLASIVFNIAVYLVITWKLHRMTIKKNGKSQLPESSQLIIDRIKYYPLCQVIARIGASWYEISYGFGFGTTIYDTDNMDSTQLTSLYLFAISTSFAGIGELCGHLFIICSSFLPFVRIFLDLSKDSTGCLRTLESNDAMSSI